MNERLTNHSFLDFSDALTGYRLSNILMLVEQVALFEGLDAQGERAAQICARIGWDPTYGKRFLDCLCSLGLLECADDHYQPSQFSRHFLCRSSPSYQGQTLAFEQQLLHSWQQLQATLRAGQRVFATSDKSAEQLDQAYSRYLGAMDEAAMLRAEEVWQAIPPLADHGRILDLGGGSGAYLATFLSRYPGWLAIYCDLPQVVDSAHHHRLAPLSKRITWCRCNLLDAAASELDAISSASCDVTLLSNLVHCQDFHETTRIIQRAAEKTAPEGLLLIHDFFSDCGWRGALYDLHMMLNTYNGRTYRAQECIAMAATRGFCCHKLQALGSGSTLLLLARTPSALR